MAGPDDIVRGDQIRWTEEVRAGPWHSVAGRRAIKAVVEDFVVDADSVGEDAIGLVATTPCADLMDLVVAE